MAASTLQELTRNDWTLIEFKAKRINFSLGQEIIQEGARIDHVYILRRGSASVELKGTHSNDSCDTGSGRYLWRNGFPRRQSGDRSRGCQGRSGS
jgi:hypothetical protein